MTRRTTLIALTGLGAVLCTGVAAASVPGASWLMPHDIILESKHAAVLVPHEHDAGDSPADAHHAVYERSDLYTPAADTWVSGISFELSGAPTSTLHHAGLSRVGLPNKTCPEHTFDQFASFASDTMHMPTLEFPTGTGILLRAGEPVQLFVMLHNPLPPVGPGETYHDVSARAILHVRPAWESHFLKPIEYRLLHLDDRPCGFESDSNVDFDFAVPASTSSYWFAGAGSGETPWKLTFSKASTIVFLGGHLHGWQGGRELQVWRNGSLVSSFETTRTPGERFGFDTPRRTTDLPVQPGDTFSISARYENEQSTPVRGAMGTLDVYYYEH